MKALVLSLIVTVTAASPATAGSACSPPEYVQPMYCTVTAEIPGVWQMHCGFGASQEEADASCTQDCGAQATTSTPLDQILLASRVNSDLRACSDSLGVPLPVPAMRLPTDELGAEFLQLLECTFVLTSNEVVYCMRGATR